MASFPLLAKTSFRMISVPSEVWDIIDPIYNQAQFLTEERDDVLQGTTTDLLYPDTIDSLHDIIEPYVREWSSSEIIRTVGYGMRSYNRGARLNMHIDAIDSHGFGCVIHIDDKVDSPWPFVYLDNEGETYKIDIKRGQALIYHGHCFHGRPEPLNGEYYRNMYLHWRPEPWLYDEEVRPHFDNIFDTLEEARGYVRGVLSNVQRRY
jgi:prolyl 4-hydroxylase